ncbi:bifunctional diguanylate cyclase/phosphodiesterase [Nocardiopsis sp. MG754419]|uniref:putative bifunctional diguanylate cyclase/phosphodiesterase n=1 Tax=Nocardiopsis sp. MG754419 TaxID=2259865 RepID=UPI001BAAB871|nr:EAL domain-containing protein [Nocardiopsis sp. MG754419]MBR8740475.1 GGDEF-domain containing protein [Nocardiopsis sp. MG754419]
MKDPIGTRDIGPRVGTPLWLYMVGATAAGAFLLGVSVLGLGPDQLFLHAREPLVWVMLCMVVLGELRPIAMPGQAPGSGAPTSLPFTFALVIFYGLPIAALVQCTATVVAGVVRTHAAHRTAFNAAQYVLSLGVADAVLRLVMPGIITTPGVPVGGEIAAVALAGAASFTVNRILVLCAVAMHERVPLRQVMFKGLRQQILVSMVLLSLAPLIVIAMTHSVLYVPLFALPLGALYTSSLLLVKRDHQANHDELTGLANRKLLTVRSRREIVRAHQNGARVGLLLLDLDRFKEVNDTLGHPTGDRLLQTLAHRLTHSVRPNDLVSRLGGDEFAILLPQVRDTESAREVALRLRGALAEPVRLDGMDFDLQVSTGIALYPDDATDFESLMQRADVAMYVAKSDRTGVESYDPGKDRNSTARLSMYSELRRGLAEGALEMRYQPKIGLADGLPVGFEALARWRHPARGLLTPDEFLPVIEHSNLFRAFTAQVLDITLARSARWHAEGLSLPVSVNLGVRELLCPDLPETVAAALREHGVAAERLVLEVGEQTLIADPEAATAAVERLRGLGVGLALDDFGTGHFTLAQLVGLPLDEVKIHESFTARLADGDSHGHTVVRASITLVRALGMRATAEGVSTAPLAEAARESGCHAAQGHHFAAPMDPREVLPWWSAHGTENSTRSQ